MSCMTCSSYLNSPLVVTPRFRDLHRLPGVARIRFKKMVPACPPSSKHWSVNVWTLKWLWCNVKGGVCYMFDATASMSSLGIVVSLLKPNDSWSCMRMLWVSLEPRMQNRCAMSCDYILQTINQLESWTLADQLTVLCLSLPKEYIVLIVFLSAQCLQPADVGDTLREM